MRSALALDGLEVALGGDEDDGDAGVALEELGRDDRLGLDERVEGVAGEAQQNHLEGNDLEMRGINRQ